MQYVRTYQIFPPCEGEVVVRYRFPPDPYNESRSMVPTLGPITSSGSSTSYSACQAAGLHWYYPGIVVAASPNPVRYTPRVDVNVTFTISMSPVLTGVYLFSPPSMGCSPMFLIVGPAPEHLPMMALRCIVESFAPDAEVVSLKNVSVILVPIK